MEARGKKYRRYVYDFVRLYVVYDKSRDLSIWSYFDIGNWWFLWDR